VFGGGLRKGGGSRTSLCRRLEGEKVQCASISRGSRRGGRFLGRGRRRSGRRASCPTRIWGGARVVVGAAILGRGRRGGARRGDFGEARAVVPWWGAPRWSKAGASAGLGPMVVLPLTGGLSVRIIGPVER
jgi:hypothetical protein